MSQERHIPVFEGVTTRIVRLRPSDGPVSMARDLPGGSLLVGGCWRGMCTLRHGALRLLVAPGDLCLLVARPSLGEELVALDDFEGLFVSLSAEGLSEQTHAVLVAFDVSPQDLLARIPAGTGFSWLTECPRVAHAMCEMDIRSMGRMGAGAYRLKTIELLHAICQASPGERCDCCASTLAAHEDIACRAQRAMTQNLRLPKTIDGLAGECHTSPTVLKQSFREVFGVSVYQWYRSYRIRRAAEMLSADSRLTVSEAAAAVGYSSHSKFSRAFGAVIGETPSAWRARVAVGER
ncbi:AraC family transcriptional regulator [Thermophilibacter immobilis]|uniref:Helix-turn-helix transcriptional regulator n=1 Tax=Thermophilibacter immobilis TaxID=2779519 RepID=A0A7S7M7F4_9ACTN|nr:AraC family transcriptional regulator [Thermophilibacter immobilis]QOY59797.1 helix-turn-helix transcriptional regulator [Thermophilibacter immobilis]